jgi:hypothetical protein
MGTDKNITPNARSSPAQITINEVGWEGEDALLRGKEGILRKSSGFFRSFFANL